MRGNNLLAALPHELRVRPQWVVWRTEQRRGRPTKVPYSVGGGWAKTDTPATWSDFGRALTYYQRYSRSFNGLGFVFCAEDGLCGIDLDKCGSEPWALDIVESLDSYTEITPSGNGFHIIAKATLPPGGRRKGQIEMYDSVRYFTMTGDRWPGTSPAIEDRQTEIEVLHAQIFGLAPPQPKKWARQFSPVAADDVALLARASNARNGPKFSALWRGDFSGYPSQSEADLALCSILAFWTGGDSDRVDQLFRQSALYRPKWDERHRGDGRTYGQATVEKACR